MLCGLAKRLARRHTLYGQLFPVYHSHVPVSPISQPARQPRLQGAPVFTDRTHMMISHTVSDTVLHPVPHGPLPPCTSSLHNPVCLMCTLDLALGGQHCVYAAAWCVVHNNSQLASHTYIQSRYSGVRLR